MLSESEGFHKTRSWTPTELVSSSPPERVAAPAVPPGWWELSTSERSLGIYVYALIYDWHAWLHRRVEQVEFVDPVTYRRQTSIDFTVPLRETPLESSEEKPIFCIPLALLRKRSLRRFSLRDQDGKALPLLTQSKNGAIGAGVLLAAAAAAKGEPSPMIPEAIRQDLWRIANLAGDEATEVWQHLGRHCAASEPILRQWGQLLVGDEQFMALAADLARNFLVLTHLRIDFGERRIVKFNYEDESQRPRWTVATKVARLRAGLAAGGRRRRRQSKAEETIREHGGTLVTVTARTRVLNRETGKLTDRTLAQPDVRLSIMSQEHFGSVGEQSGSRGGVISSDVGRATDAASEPTTVEVSTSSDGRTACVVPNGPARFVTRLPAGIVEEGASVGEERVSGELRLTGEPVALLLEYRQVSSAPEASPEATTSPITLPQLITRSISWRPRRLAIFAPAVGEGQSHHLEVEVPEGLSITRAKLLDRPSYFSADGKTAAGSQDLELGPAQRVHLHIRDVAQSATAIAVLDLRPQASVILRAGTISTLASTVLIGLIAKDHAQLIGAAGTVATLLLVVPGGLSAYISRPRENPLTSSIVFGLRVLTLASSFVALVAAASVVLSHRWHISKGQVVAGGEWPAAGAVLSVCFWSSLAICLVLLVACFWTVRKPERRSGALK